jgi:hypothetical protein
VSMHLVVPVYSSVCLYFLCFILFFLDYSLLCVRVRVRVRVRVCFIFGGGEGV